MNETLMIKDITKTLPLVSSDFSYEDDKRKQSGFLITPLNLEKRKHALKLWQEQGRTLINSEKELSSHDVQTQIHT
jgi:hypothetical protein